MTRTARSGWCVRRLRVVAVYVETNGLRWETGIDVSGDGEYLCVAGTTSWYAAVVPRQDLELVNTIEVGKRPYWVQIAPDGQRAFVAVKGEDSVVDCADASEVARIPVGDDPMVTEHRTVPESVL